MTPPDTLTHAVTNLRALVADIYSGRLHLSAGATDEQARAYGLLWHERAKAIKILIAKATGDA